MTYHHHYHYIIIIILKIITIEDGDSLALERVPKVDCVVVVTWVNENDCDA